MAYVPKLMCKEQHREEQSRKTVHAPCTPHARLLIRAASVHAAAGSLSPGVEAGCLLLPCASDCPRVLSQAACFCPVQAVRHMPHGT